MRRALAPACALLAVALAGCDRGGGECVCPSPLEAERARTREFLDRNQGRAIQAVARARTWLDGLTVDPIALRQAGIKGKKKLAELLDAYVRLHAIGSPAEQAEILERVESIVAVTRTAAYHDMLECDERQFKQDATSYLRVAYLMEGLGLETGAYREEIRKIHGRLDGHMARRGSHQRMAFHWYYQHFGLSEPFDLAAGFAGGVIAARLDPYRYRSNLKVYHLTHEIFVPYRYGEKLDADFFSPDELRYLRHALDRLSVHYIMRGDPDLTAELISCLRYLRMTDLAVYREGLGFLLDSQRAEGKWGDYERYRERFGDLVDQGFYLHTTMVALDALTNAFYRAEHRLEQGAGGPVQ